MPRTRIYRNRTPIELTLEDFVNFLVENGEILLTGQVGSLAIWTEYLFDGTPYYCNSTGDEYDCPHHAILDALAIIEQPIETDPSS